MPMPGVPISSSGRPEASFFCVCRKLHATEEIKETILFGEIIEEYLEDQRGESCLLLHTKENRVIHVVCAPKSEYLAIITAYLPVPDQWSSDFKERK